MEKGFELLTEKEEMWAEMLKQVLEDNGITCVAVPVYGAGFVLKTGGQDHLKIYVPAESMPRAEELLNELFPEDGAEPFSEYEGGDLTITWLGHACFCVESEGYRIVLDPFKGVRGYADPHVTANEVLCSHEHFDHNFRDAVTLEEGGESPFTVETVATCHDDQGGALRGPNTVHILRAGGQTVVHLGDLGHQLTEEQAEKLRGCDVLLIPVGGTYTIDAAGAKQVADVLKPRIIVPMHYRRGPIGFENIGALDDFLDLFPAERVHLLAENSFDPAEYDGVVVLHYQA